MSVQLKAHIDNNLTDESTQCHTHGVQPSYSSQRWSTLVASWMMKSTCRGGGVKHIYNCFPIVHCLQGLDKLYATNVERKKHLSILSPFLSAHVHTHLLCDTHSVDGIQISAIQLSFHPSPHCHSMGVLLLEGWRGEERGGEGRGGEGSLQ